MGIFAHSFVITQMKIYLNMKKVFGFIFSIVSAILFVACSSSSPNQKSIPEAQVRTFGQVSETVTEELSLVAIKSKYLLQDTINTKVFLYVDAYKGQNPISVNDFIKNYNLNYVIYSDYGTRDRQGYGNIKLENDNVHSIDNKIVISFEFKSPDKASGVLLSEISQIGTLKKVLNDLTIEFKNKETDKHVGVYTENENIPLKRHFVRTDESFNLKDLNGATKPLQVFYYSHAFDPAGSPMNTAPKTASQKLEIDSTFNIATNEKIKFTKEGLYNIFADTTQKEGLGILVVNERFPKTTRPELLLEPLLYMSTNNEIKEIQSTDNYKRSLDTYWLNLMNGNAPLAQQSIRNYYHRVEDANQLFTTYKEGWKTDQGMIYIVLGPPDKVQRSKDKEVWTYSQRGNAQNVNFTFNRRNNQFVDDHYELVRYAEYQPIWYPVVEAWRNGSIR